MATTASFPTLPVPEDSMDVSSPGNQSRDVDIDLDFTEGDYDGGVQLQEDELMLTDGEQTRPATATDDMMDDDVRAAAFHVHEEVMHDTPDVDQTLIAQQDDEELIDYGEDDVDLGQQIEDATLVNADDAFATVQELDENIEQVDEEFVRQPEEAATEQPAHLEAVEFTEYPDLVAADTEAGEAPYGDGADLNVSHPELSAEDTYGAVLQEEHVGVEERAQEVEPQESAAEDEIPLQLNTSFHADAQTQADGPPTPTDTGLHPMTLYYAEHAMPLFKSKNQPDGLLKDDNLASLSLHELMNNCRERLALKIGNIPEEQEFTLAFDHLGLMLVENARAAFEHSLNDVLDTYLHLHHNDGTFDIPPLSLTLTHQQFSNQLAVLKQAVEAGQGMSMFVPAIEEEQEYHGEGDAHGVVGDEYVEQEQSGDGQQSTEEDNERDQANELAQQDEEQYDEGAGQEQHQEEEQQGEGHAHSEVFVALQESGEAQEDQGHEHQESVDYTGDEGLAAGVSQAGEHNTDGVVADAHDLYASEAQDAPTEDTAGGQQLGEESHVEVQEAASTASSQTLEGNDGTESTEPAADAHVDLSTLTEVVAEHDKLDLQADSTAEGTEEYPKDEKANTDVDASATNQAEAGEEPLYLDSEDFLGDEAYQAQSYNADGEGEQQEQGVDGHYGQEEYNDQADTLDNQQPEGFHLPGDDERDETAKDDDFLQGRDYQNEFKQQLEWNVDLTAGENGDGTEIQQPTGDEDDQLDERLLDDEDEIGFDDDTTEQHAAREASKPNGAAHTPLGGKRSFEELAAEDELQFDDEPEVKKVRSV